MADISILLRLINGVARNVDISANTLVMSSLKLGTSELTKAKLDLLVLTTDSPTAVDASAEHHHDGLYFTETELGAQTNGASGASLIGIDVTPAFTNFTSGNNVQSALEGIDSALGAATGEQVKVSVDDTTAGYLAAKIQVDIGTNATDALEESILNPAGNEILRVRFDASKVDHGDLTGLGDDDHTQYILVAGTRAFSADQAMGGFKLTSLAAGSAAGHSVRYEQVILRDGSQAFTADQSMGGFKLTSVADPTLAQDAATKAYVDSLIDGRDWKQSVRAATTAALPAVTYVNGAGTLTADANGALPAQDGVTLVNNNRLLVKDQASQFQNGIYIVTDIGSGGTPFILTRTSDADAALELEGAAVFADEGTANGDKQFAQTADSITLGTTAIVWVVTSANAFSGHDMVSLSGGQISVDLTSDAGLESSNPGNAAGQLRVKLDGSTLARSSAGLRVSALGITNAEISASAAIAYSKLDLLASIVNADINASAAIAYSKLNLASSIVNADINASAAIAYSKLALNNSIVLDDLTSLSVDENKLTASVAGNGLTGGAGSALAVGANADGTVVVNANDIQVAHAPRVVKAGVAGEAFAANTTFAVRMAVSGETAGRWYKADFDASASNNFYVYGVIEGLGAAAKVAADPITVVMMGTVTLGSSDTNFAAGEIGQPVHLIAAGAFDAVSQITYTLDQASYRFGVVQEVDKVLVGNMQLLGIN